MKKKIALRLLAALIVLGACAALVIFVGIPLFSEEEVVHTRNPKVMYYEGNGKALTMENEALLFEMDPSTTYFTVTDKATGNQWTSVPVDAAKDPVANTANKETMQSTLVITYSTSQGTVDLNNYKYSIENGNFDVQPQEDGSIRVDYAVGKIEKIYRLPTAITKERYDAFVGQMKNATKKKLSSNYTLYEPAKLDSKKNKDEIIALYPSVVDTAMYILKSGTSENNKKKIEGYWAEVGYSEEDYAIDMQLVAGQKESNTAVFNVSLVYALEGKDLVVRLPYESVRYRAEYPMTYVTLLPVFGAAGTADEGYMLVPEGGGSIINLNNGKVQQNAYYTNLYGWDYGVTRKELINETRSAFPVFGMVRNGASFLCMMEGATSFAGVQADISGRNTSYNFVNAKYNVIHADQYNVSAKTAQLVYMFEQNVPEVDVVHRYRFVPGASYVDMANAYGEYLAERYPEMVQGNASEDVPVSIEMIGAIDKTVVKFGLPVDDVVATTTFEDAKNIISDLTTQGVRNLNVRFAGWANGGITQQVMTRVKVLKELGGTKGMDALIASAREMNVPLYFDGVNCFAYDSGMLEGFVPFTHAARYATREQIMLLPFDIVQYQKADWLDSYYLVRPDYAHQNAANMINHLAGAKAYGVSFRDIGTLLSADYNPKDTTTREQVKEMDVQTMKDALASGQRVMIRSGNDYAVPYADIVTDMDLRGSRYSILDGSVPFYQIALHGMKDYTGEPINLAGDYVQELLSCVEYGAGLHFTFMAEDANVLQDTTHSGFFGANYDEWKADAVEMILRYQKEAKGLNQQRIVEHERITDLVTMTAYEDGTRVYVNYGMNDYAEGGVAVPARNYIVERGQ